MNLSINYTKKRVSKGKPIHHMHFNIGKLDNKMVNYITKKYSHHFRRLTLNVNGKILDIHFNCPLDFRIIENFDNKDPIKKSIITIQNYFRKNKSYRIKTLEDKIKELEYLVHYYKNNRSQYDYSK